MALNWETAEPCIIENSDTGQMFYGDTDTPIKEWLNIDGAYKKALDYIQAADEDMVVDLLKFMGHNTVCVDFNEFIILEDKNE